MQLYDELVLFSLVWLINFNKFARIVSITHHNNRK